MKMIVYFIVFDFKYILLEFQSKTLSFIIIYAKRYTITIFTLIFRLLIIKSADLFIAVLICAHSNFHNLY